MMRNSTLCQWLMLGHLSNAISCSSCVLLVYCQWMGTCIGLLLGLVSCTLAIPPPPLGGSPVGTLPWVEGPRVGLPTI